jgi:hypothetical protein
MWVVGGVLVVVVAVLLAVWLWQRSARHEPPPELEEDTPGPPADRDPTWDPRRRYDE